MNSLILYLFAISVCFSTRSERFIFGIKRLPYYNYYETVTNNPYTIPGKKSTYHTTEYPSSPKIWALLVAGSYGYDNYRHQADVCHAYQILRENRIPEEHIIVMMYDDIAYSKYNPNPGVLINEPNGTNVYKGVRKDYTGKTITPVNFLNVLKGEKKAMEGIGSGRVIESGPNDFIFVYFVDHGDTGILCFPEDDLSAADLIQAFNNMTSERRFKEMILYVEACNAGSMFNQILSDNNNIFVMTAADPNESSWACYCDLPDYPCLADLFSFNWMQEAETESLPHSSLNHLFEIVRTRTNKSHVEEYGDLDIGSTLLSKVIGYRHGNITNKNHTVIKFCDLGQGGLPQPEVALAMIEKQLKQVSIQNSNNLEQIRELEKKKKQLEDESLTYLKVTNEMLVKIADSNLDKYLFLVKPKFKIELSTSNMLCHKQAVQTFRKTCVKLNFNNRRGSIFYQALVNACSADWTNTAAIVGVIKSVCKG